MKSYLFCVYLIVSTSETSGFDRDGPSAAATECVPRTPYSRYRNVTCLTDACAIERSTSEHSCRYGTTTYCYHQCSLLERRPIFDSRPLPRQPVILPRACYSPAGTRCGWYRQCLARMFPCTGQAEYAIGYGEQFCQLYEESKSNFSPKALEWLDAARKCLQDALVPALQLCQVQPTCEDIRTKAFESHVPCYVQPRDGLSVCDLALTDWINIFTTIKGSFVSSAWLETLMSSALIAGECASIFAQQLGNYLFSIVVSV